MGDVADEGGPGREIRSLQSADPLEPLTNPPDPLGEPRDQSNAIRDFRAQAARIAGIPPFDVRQLRANMRLTQREFASYFGFALATLKHWERGNRQPTGAALVLLAVIHAHPRDVLVTVR